MTAILYQIFINKICSNYVQIIKYTSFDRYVFDKNFLICRIEILLLTILYIATAKYINCRLTLALLQNSCYNDIAKPTEYISKGYFYLYGIVIPFFCNIQNGFC